MTTLAINSSVTVTLKRDAVCKISTNGGYASVMTSPTVGSASLVVLGPEPTRRTIGPFSEGASLTISNQTVSPACDILLESAFPSQNTSVPLATEALYRNAMIEIATLNNVPYVDHYAKFVSWERSSTYSLTGDSYHPNNLGYWVKEGALFEALKAV